MLPYFWYILKMIICSGILFGYYWIFLRNKIFHQYNRFYLLSAIVLSLLLPLLKIDFWQPQPDQSQAIRVLQAVSAGDEYMNNVIISASSESWSIQQLYPVIYWAVCLIFLLVLLRTLFIIRSLLKKYPSSKIDDISFINTNDRSTPFSFLKFIFWNDGIDINSTTGNQIFKHEVAHIQEKHTHDKLFVNILLIFFWCNPFFWLYRKELNMIHEFIADKKAVEDSDTASFAAMILQATYPRHRFELANNFFYSPIKRRLLMLTRNKNPKVNYMARIMVLPLAVLIFAAFTFKTKNKAHHYNGQKITVVIDAGHGGKDAGARSADGILEKDIVLEIAKKVKELNDNGAIEIILTRDKDIYMDPTQKIAFAKSMNADLIISFHADAAPEPGKKSGISFLVAKDSYANSAESKVLASSLINEFTGNYKLNVFASPQQRNHGIWILQESNVPAVLIEAGCMTNPVDISYLKTEAAKETIAKNVLAAIEKFAASGQVDRSVLNNIVADTVPTGIFINVKNADSAYLRSPEFKSKALVIVDSKEIGNVGNDYVEKDADKYSSVIVYGPDKAKMMYGEKGRYGVLKLTQKDAIFMTAESVTYDEKTKSITLTGKDTKVTGDMSNTLIYVDGIACTPAQLNEIAPEKINTINILKGEKLDEIADAKGKTAIINVSLKPADLAEVVVVAGKPLEKEIPFTIIRDNILYVGIENPVSIAVPGVETDKLMVSIDNGSITGRNGKFTISVQKPGTSTLKIYTIKNDRKELLSERIYSVRLLGDPTRIVDTIPHLQSTDHYKMLLEKQLQTNSEVKLRTLADKKLQEAQIQHLKQSIELLEKTKQHTDIAQKAFLENKLKSLQQDQFKQNLQLNYKAQLELTTKDLISLQAAEALNRQVLREKAVTGHQLEALKYNLVLAEKSNAKFKDSAIQKLLLEQKELLLKQNYEKIQDATTRKLLQQQKEIFLTQQDNSIVFSKVEIEPSFPGGQAAWRKYLEKNLDVSVPLLKGAKTGKYTVIMKFIVYKDGSLGNITCENDPGFGTCTEAKRVIKVSPKWEPAVQNGKKVNAYRKQPIIFVVSE